ncbi:MAG: gephyrin-like molybdotransferase Glp, partial [Pseudomonadota bacterium]
MSVFDSFVVVDWSSGNDTGPRPRKDAVWIGAILGGVEQEPFYARNRDVAFAWLKKTIAEEIDSGRRLLVGFDFPFGYPKGFAKQVTGSTDPFALWEFFHERLVDTPKQNNRFDLAGEINQLFKGVGPFWFNALKRDVSGLPRKGTARHGHRQKERRIAEEQAKGAFTCWQMGGAGAVGGQVFTGLAMLQRLRLAFPGQIAVWPFQTGPLPVHFVEIWPSLIDPVVNVSGDDIRDRAQVRLLSRALANLHPDRLAIMLKVDAPEEGWILGVAHEAELQEAAAALLPPRLKNDCFALPPGVDWTPVDDALARLRDRLGPVVGIEGVASNEALNRVLALDVDARRSNPPAANSAVDGYAFAHASSDGGDQVMPLCSGRAAAGAPFEGVVPAGHAVQILTGALLPDGVDTVVLNEDVSTDGGRIAFEGPIKKGANARKAGEDVLAGETVLAASTRLGPAQIALLNATGVTAVRVFRPLRVGVLSTGDEVVDAGQTEEVSRTYDANRPMLLALLQDWNISAIDLGHVPDDREALRQRLNEAAMSCDAILTSGGASAGDEDHVSALLEENDSLGDWRIALKPGRPLALGMWGGVPIFGLPGNPVAALVCTLIFARPALGLLGGETWRAPQGFSVPAAFSKSKKPGRREYLRARMTAEGTVEVFHSEGSGRISGLSWADGLVELPDEAVEITLGTPVRYLPYASF